MKDKRHSILIILIAGIGDLVLASKSLRSIRNGNSDAEIHLLTSTQAASLAKNYEYIDHVWTFPVRELREDKFQLLKIFQLIWRLRRIDFNAIINLYRISTWKGSLEMGLLFMVLRGKKKIGHNNRGFGLLLDKKAPRNTFRNQHVADAMMTIAKLGGGITDDEGTEIFWDKKGETKYKSLLTESIGDSKEMKIAINPGGDRENRRWKPEYYASVADTLIKGLNAKAFILGGPGEEKIAEEIQMKMKNRASNLSGQLMLSDLVSIIKKMDLLITNDSGPMHIASALKTPVVAIFGPEDPQLFGPYTTPDLYKVIYRDIDCRPCKKKKCTSPLCLDQITPEEVIEKCFEILNPAK